MSISNQIVAKRWTVIALMLTLLISAGCGNREQSAANANLPRFVISGDEGEIKGSVSYQGSVPAPTPLKMDKDDVCAKKNENAVSEELVVHNNRLANVVVYVENGPTKKFSYATPAEPVVLGQQGCQYVPHVVALQTQQPLKITTSDATSHNIHPLPKDNQEWNRSQPANGEPFTEKFSKPEIFPVKCDQHPWMRAYLAVFDHPYFAVTDADGSFDIKNLPPGDYSLIAWQEKLGTQQFSITVKAKAVSEVNVNFPAAQASSSETSSSALARNH